MKKLEKTCIPDLIQIWFILVYWKKKKDSNESLGGESLYGYYTICNTS